MKQRKNNNSSRPSLLYLMHVDWDWIKQRPHFIAEELAEEFDIEVLYVRGTGDSKSQIGANASSVRRLPLLKLPFSGRRNIVKSIQKRINIKRSKQKHFDYVWICAPEILDYIELSHFSHSKVIYDCMDDMITEMKPGRLKDKVISYENQIISRSDFIFASSASLEEKLLKKGAVQSKLSVVRNALSHHDLRRKSRRAEPAAGVFITYFGAISSWIDLDLINKLADASKPGGAKIRIIGPGSDIVPQHDRIETIGAVPRHELPKLMTGNDIFILPFKMNEITRSVDPVKMYEYIRFGGKIVARRYPEIQHFGRFVDFYDTHDEAISIVDRYVCGEPRKYTDQEAAEFLRDNTWQNRSNQIISKIMTSSNGANR